MICIVCDTNCHPARIRSILVVYAAKFRKHIKKKWNVNYQRLNRKSEQAKLQQCAKYKLFALRRLENKSSSLQTIQSIRHFLRAYFCECYFVNCCNWLREILLGEVIKRKIVVGIEHEHVTRHFI